MFEEKRFDLLTMSVGLTTYQEGYSVRKFIQYTDSLMYDAKRAGGNRVYVFGTDETAEESTTA
jgi:PleD family two-component response regulator